MAINSAGRPLVSSLHPKGTQLPVFYEIVDRLKTMLQALLVFHHKSASDLSDFFEFIRDQMCD